MAVEISVEGKFASRQEAADALEEVASRIRRGEYCAQAHRDDNPVVFVIGGWDDDA